VADEPDPVFVPDCASAAGTPIIARKAAIVMILCMSLLQLFIIDSIENVPEFANVPVNAPTASSNHG
jgi:hypothetical protein